MSETWIEWVEPFSPTNEPVYCRVSEKTATEVQMSIAAGLGKPYTDEKDALDDFIVVHWARRIPPDTVMKLEAEIKLLKDKLREAQLEHEGQN